MATITKTERREKLARNINIIMETYKITIKELAAELDRDRHTVYLHLKCPWLFTVEDLEHIAEIGGVTVEELMSGDLVKTVRVVDYRKIKKNKEKTI
ncbi:MAG: hypothetical protein J6K29_12675 [Clostridia bacterium]|nr:hypothetical protein [Clostridia bacterium]MBP3667889.1 hypothetical protein [Clostridia bacterium]